MALEAWEVDRICSPSSGAELQAPGGPIWIPCMYMPAGALPHVYAQQVPEIDDDSRQRMERFFKWMAYFLVRNSFPRPCGPPGGLLSYRTTDECKARPPARPPARRQLPHCLQCWTPTLAPLALLIAPRPTAPASNSRLKARRHARRLAAPRPRAATDQPTRWARGPGSHMDSNALLSLNN